MIARILREAGRDPVAEVAKRHSVPVLERHFMSVLPRHSVLVSEHHSMSESGRIFRLSARGIRARLDEKARSEESVFGLIRQVRVRQLGAG